MGGKNRYQWRAQVDTVTCQCGLVRQIYPEISRVGDVEPGETKLKTPSRLVSAGRLRLVRVLQHSWYCRHALPLCVSTTDSCDALSPVNPVSQPPSVDGAFGASVHELAQRKGRGRQEEASPSQRRPAQVKAPRSKVAPKRYTMIIITVQKSTPGKSGKYNLALNIVSSF